jgi:hypothetical protein
MFEQCARPAGEAKTMVVLYSKIREIHRNRLSARALRGNGFVCSFFYFSARAFAQIAVCGKCYLDGTQQKLGLVSSFFEGSQFCDFAGRDVVAGRESVFALSFLAFIFPSSGLICIYRSFIIGPGTQTASILWEKCRVGMGILAACMKARSQDDRPIPPAVRRWPDSGWGTRSGEPGDML